MDEKQLQDFARRISKEVDTSKNQELIPAATYVSLHYLAKHSCTATALAVLDAQEPRYYATHIGQSGDDLVAMWAGDAGYESGEADTLGPRHRLHMSSGGFEFDDSGIS